MEGPQGEERPGEAVLDVGPSLLVWMLLPRGWGGLLFLERCKVGASFVPLAHFAPLKPTSHLNDRVILGFQI